MASGLTRWEYTTVNLGAGRGTLVSRSEQERLLNEEGRRGWELVTLYEGVAYFKRPIDSNLGPVLD